jgi:homoserine O-acetyltransferase
VQQDLPDEYNKAKATMPGQVESPVPQMATLTEPGKGFRLESGQVLPELKLRYETYGEYTGNNAVLVFHALTGSAHLAGTYSDETLAGLTPLEQAFGQSGWWDELVGDGRLLDPKRYHIISVNHVGSCYGSTGPVSINPATGQSYGPDFPLVSVRDMVRAQILLLDRLGIQEVTLIGGSLGGMVAMEFALLYPERTQKLAVMAAPPVHGPWARAFNRLSRDSITADPGYREGRYTEQPAGLRMARSIAMLSYRSPGSFQERWQGTPEQGESYVTYQGEKFLKRFDANTYLALSQAMDTHDVGRGRGNTVEALDNLSSIPSLFVGINSDVLYTASEVRACAEDAGGQYAEINSPHGHDAFLLEMRQLDGILRGFLGGDAEG